MTRVHEHRIPGHRVVLRSGVELTVVLPGHFNGTRSRFLWADTDTGDVTVSARGKTRTVPAAAVRSIHAKRKLR